MRVLASMKKSFRGHWPPLLKAIGDRFIRAKKPCKE